MEFDFWKKRWADGSTGWDLGRSHAQCPEVKNLIRQFNPKPNARMLVPGCGSGHDAAYFAQNGFEVTACDIVEDAVMKGRKLYGALPNLQFLQQDVLQEKSFKSGDFDVVYDRAMLCALSEGMRTKYIENCARWLGQDGHFISLLFSKRRRDESKGPPFAIPLRDFISLIKNLFVIEDIFEYESDDIEIISQESRVLCRLKGEAE